MNPLLVPMLPLVGSLLVATARNRRLAAGLAAGTVIADLASALVAVAQRSTQSLRWGGDLFIETGFTGSARFMAVLVPVIALPVIVYAIRAEREDPGQVRLLALMVAFVGAMQLLVSAQSFLVLLAGWELVGACSWALVGHDWRDRESLHSANHAFLTTLLGDLGLFLAAGAALAGTGSLSFPALQGAGPVTLSVVGAGVLLAATSKSGQLPFSPWLFSAMAGPTPVSALLHSATMVAAGAFLLARLAPLLSPVGWFADAVITIGLASALAGGVVALLQTHIKRALAASTTAQYGLMLVAIGAGSPAAGSLQLITHAFFKALLFLGAGVAIHAVGTGDLGDMRLGRSRPLTAGMFGVGALALAGIPPLGGGFSKGFILSTAAHSSPALAAGVALAAALSAAYAGRLFLLAFGWGRPAGREAVTALEVWAMGLLTAGSLALAALGSPSVRTLLVGTGGSRFLTPAWELPVSLLAAATGFALVWAMQRQGRLVTMGLNPQAAGRLAGWFGLGGAARALLVDPVLALSLILARFDDAVIDAGIRGVGRISDAVSKGLAWWGERGLDGVVWGVGRAALGSARGSQIWDDRVVDASVEGLAGGVAIAGRHSRRLQTGQAHHYYVLAAAGAVLVAVAAGAFR